MSIKQDQYYPTAGQLEREVSQKINTLYYDQFGHRAGKVDCHLFDNKIIIISEDVITPIEKLLLTAPSFDLIHQTRTFLDSLIQTRVKNLVKEVTKIEVNSCVYNTTVENDSAVAIVVLAKSPRIRPKKVNRRINHKNIVQFSQSKDNFPNLIELNE
jgi:uncharacterized protein YbcI